MSPDDGLPPDVASIRLAVAGDLNGALGVLAPAIDDVSVPDQLRQYLLQHRAIIYSMFGRLTDEAADLTKALDMKCGTNQRRFALMLALGHNAERAGDSANSVHWYREALQTSVAHPEVAGCVAALALIEGLGHSPLSEEDRQSCYVLVERGSRTLGTPMPENDDRSSLLRCLRLLVDASARSDQG